MTDIYEQPPQEEKTTVTIDDVQAQPRKRTSRAKSDEQKEPKEKPAPKRAAKLDGKDVEKMFELGSSTAVMLGAHPDWYINGKEVAPCSKEIAELLNRIPIRYAEAAVNLSGYATIGYGLYQVFNPRIEAERARRKMSQNGVQRELEFAK